MATLPDWADFAWWRSSIGESDISGKGLVEKEAMERKHSEEEADLYDPEGQSWTNTAAQFRNKS